MFYQSSLPRNYDLYLLKPELERGDFDGDGKDDFLVQLTDRGKHNPKGPDDTALLGIEGIKQDRLPKQIKGFEGAGIEKVYLHKKERNVSICASDCIPLKLRGDALIVEGKDTMANLRRGLCIGMGRALSL